MYKIAFILSLAFSIHSTDINTGPTWFENIDAAKQHAADNQKNILMVFAGSDWCKPCIKFKKDILQDSAFENWAREKLVILYLDFPARKKNKLPKDQKAHNEKLAEQFNKSGAFPSIYLLDHNEKVIAQPIYKGQTAEVFIKQIKDQLNLKK